jgi:hypothetical protein
MKNYFILFCFVAVLSCNNRQQQSPGTIVKKDTVVGTTPVQQTVIATLTILPFDKKNVPFKDNIKGIIIDGASFKDAEGENYVVLTELDNGEKNGTQNKTIYAYCFTKQDKAFVQKWLVQDNISGCEVDATCEFLPGSLSITDVDSNKIAETSFLYQLSCKGDVSPHSKKMIMYQGADKFAIRGSTILQTPAGTEGGDKKIDVSFAHAPKVLLEYANKQWDKFGFQKY